MSSRKLLLLTSLAFSGAAFAAPGDHVRIGDATFIPAVDVGGEYRTNLYRSEADPLGGANLRVAPQGTLSVAGEDHSFKLAGMWELRKFLFSQSEAEGAVSNLDRFNDFGVTAGASLFRREVVGLELSDSINLRNNSTDAEFSETPFTSQFRNSLNGGLRINPGPALTITPGATWSFDQYRVPGAPGERLLNARHQYGPTLAAGWAFLPRTSLYANASYVQNAWVEGPIAASVASGALDIPNSQFIRTMVGIDGRFTERLFLNFGAGYGVGLYEDGVNVSGLDGLLLRAEGRYQLREATETSSGTAWSLGYDKQFRDSFFTNSVTINRVYTGVQAGIGNFQPELRYEIRFEGYDGAAVVRNDVVNRVTADFAYRLKNWASVTPGVYWQQRASNVDNVEYDDVNIHLLGTFTY